MTRHDSFYVTPFESNTHACAVHAVCESNTQQTEHRTRCAQLFGAHLGEEEGKKGAQELIFGFRQINLWKEIASERKA